MQEKEKFKTKAMRNCSRCGRQKKNGFRVKGGYFHRDRHHDLCYRCFRSEMERQRQCPGS
jgi:hypothetical protein